MQQKEKKALLLKYLENRCSDKELKKVSEYFANAEYPDSFDELLEQGWKKFNAQHENDEKIASDLFEKFNQRLKTQGGL